MSDINYPLSEATYYLNGTQSEDTKLVGIWDYNDTDGKDTIGVIRYTFRTGNHIVSKLSVDISDAASYSNSRQAASEVSTYTHLACAITPASSDKYKGHYGNNGATNGKVAISGLSTEGDSAQWGLTMAATIENIVLMPNSTYYLWIYPNSKGDGTNGGLGRRFLFTSATFKVSPDISSPGLCHIKTKDGVKSAMMYIKDDGELKRIVPNIKRDGKLHICS